MILKKLISLISAVTLVFSALISANITVIADDELEPIKCTQSASYLNNNGDVAFTLNTSDIESPTNISWNTSSSSWKGVGVLEFNLPPIDASLVKSAELTYSVHNGSSRSGGRTYTIYESDITIDKSTTADTIKSIPLTNIIYEGAPVNQYETRTDTVSDNVIKDYIKGKVNSSADSKVQFAFSNSSQVLDINPSTASLKIVLYGGGIALDNHELSLLTNSSPVKLNLNIFEQDIQKDTLIWESSDSEIVSVNDGTITPKKAGTAIITVKTTDNQYSDECHVTVNQAVESIELDKTTLNLMAGGENGELVVKYSPSNAVNRKIEWQSSNTDIADVSSSGIVTPKSEGSTTITATIADTEINAACLVTVTPYIEPTSISLDKTNLSLPKLGSTAVIKTTVLPQNADSRIIWTSSNTNVAKVFDGVVVAGEVGEATITASTSNGKTAQCTVTVTDDKQLITNDYFYKDTDGNTLFSQGGGIFKFPGDDTYYWYGVRYAESVTYANDPAGATRNVEHPVMEAYTCYSSKDLVNWKYEGDVATNETLGAERSVWAGRCGVVYNENTKKYILVSQFDGEIIASADSPLGPFERETHFFWGNLKGPNGESFITNNQTGDLTMFYDDDGKAYMICSSANGRAHLYVVPMRESDYCHFDVSRTKEIPGSTSRYFDEDGTIKTKDKGGIEGDCMFKYKAHYYFTGSDLYGWHGSRCYVFESDSILGSYSIKPDYVSENDKNQALPYIMPGVKNNYAHNSQTGFYYTLHGTEQDLVIYCGDRWSSFCSNGLGFNQWVPLTMDGYTPHFNNLSQWRLDSATGTWEIGDGNNYVANSYFDADRVDLNNLTGWECSDNIGGIANGNVKDKLYSGKYSARQSADEDYIATMKQTISDLPDGTYTLRAIAKSSGDQNNCKLYLKTDDKEYSKSLKSSMNEWTDIVIKDIEIKDGKCEVGLFSDANAGNYVRIDDIFLTRNYDGTVIEGKMNTNVPDTSETYAEDGIKITAEYENNGTLKSIKSVDTIKAGDTVTDTDDVNIKIFTWKSFEDIRPVSTKKS